MAKSLKKTKSKSSKPKRPDIALDKSCVPGTSLDPERDQMLTDLGSFKIGWANCGRCHAFYRSCSCRGGVLHPSSVEWAYIIQKIREDGEFDGRQPVMNDHRVQGHGLYWYAPKRTSERLVPPRATVKHPPRSNTTFEKPKKRLGKSAAVETKSLKKRLGEDPRTVESIDLKKMEKVAAKKSAKSVDDAIKAVKQSATKKKIGKKPLRKRA